MTDNKIQVDEANRTANFEGLKSGVDDQVNAHIIAAASQDPRRDAELGQVANRMHDRAVSEMVESEKEVERGRIVARISQVVDYLFLLVYGLLAIRLLLELFAARESAGFFRFIKTLTGPLYAPFQGLVPSPSTPEGFTLALPIIVAIVVYMLLHLAINGFLRILAHRKVEI